MIKVGDLVRYDPSIFEPPTLSEVHGHPFGWLKDDYEGTEQTWIGLVLKVDNLMWGKQGGTGYEIMWHTGRKEKVYAFEVEKIVDTTSEV